MYVYTEEIFFLGVYSRKVSHRPFFYHVQVHIYNSYVSIITICIKIIKCRHCFFISFASHTHELYRIPTYIYIYIYCAMFRQNGSIKWPQKKQCERDMG